VSEHCRCERGDAITSLVASANATAKALAERDAARAALARVEALHVRDGDDPDPDVEWCAGCHFSLPCPTIRALTEWDA